MPASFFSSLRHSSPIAYLCVAVHKYASPHAHFARICGRRRLCRRIRESHADDANRLIVSPLHHTGSPHTPLLPYGRARLVSPERLFAPSPSLFRHAAEALPQPRKHTERAFPHAARSAGHLPGGHERAENGLPAFCFAILFCQKRVKRKAYFYAFPPLAAHLRRCVRACRSVAPDKRPPCGMSAEGRCATNETALSRKAFA